MNNDIKIGPSIGGRYKVQILENGVVVKDNPWENNLILNSMLDTVCVGYVPQRLTTYHVVGTGTTAPAVTDTALVNEVRRTNTYLTGAGNCGMSQPVAGTFNIRRTYDHAIEVSAQNYTEHGLSNGPTGTILYTRALFTAGTVTVDVGQQLRIIYDIVVVVSPSVLTPITVGGTGWPVLPATNCDGNMVLGDSGSLIGTLNVDGSGGNTWGILCNNPGFGFGAMCDARAPGYSPYYGADMGYAGAITNSSIVYGSSSYVTGTYTFTLGPTGYATATSYSSTSIAGFCISNIGYGYNLLHFKYDQPQTKANTHRLRYPSITITWNRL